MAQAVSRRPLTLEARIRVRIVQCGICGGQSGAATDFSPSSLVFPCHYHSTVAVHNIIWGMNSRPLVAAVQRHSLTPSTGRTTTMSQPRRTVM
jgi:hypothetical protein